MIIDLGEKKLKVCTDIINKLFLYRQKSSFAKEAGGIIIGRVSNENSNVILEYITTPLPNDECTVKKFIRKDDGHIKIFLEKYNESQGAYAYMGEWHSHFEKVPMSSSADLENWKKLGAEMRKSGIDQYYIIVGCDAFGLWCYINESDKINHLGDFNWEEFNLYEKICK